MNTEKKICISLHEVKKMMESGRHDEAQKAVQNLWKVVGRLGKNNEALSCSYLHTEETIKECETENRIILSSEQMLYQIKLRS